jgi:hypothetical protein
VGMDYVASLAWAAAPVLVSQVAMAGIVAELARMGLPAWWPIRRGSVPPPYVSSLNRRLLFILIPLFSFGIALLFWADINISLRVSTGLVEEEMTRSAQDAGREIPFFIQTGRTYIHDVARQGGWLQGDSISQSARLSQLMRAMPFFRQLTLFDAQGQAVAGFPANDRQFGLTGDEAPLVKLAITANVPQDMTVYPSTPDDVVGVVFVTPVLDPQTQLPI